MFSYILEVSSLLTSSLKIGPSFSLQSRLILRLLSIFIANNKLRFDRDRILLRFQIFVRLSLTNIQILVNYVSQSIQIRYFLQTS